MMKASGDSINTLELSGVSKTNAAALTVEVGVLGAHEDVAEDPEVAHAGVKVDALDTAGALRGEWGKLGELCRRVRGSNVENTRVDNNKTNKAHANRFCSTASHHSRVKGAIWGVSVANLVNM